MVTKVHKTYQFKLKPNKTQANIFHQWLGTCRYLYNSALEHRISYFKDTGEGVSKYDQYNELPQIKRELPFVAKVYSDVLQEVLDRIDKSYKLFFKGGGFPKFKNKYSYNSFTYKRNYKINENKVKLPKIGWVKFFNSRPIKGKPKTATLIFKNNSWFISIVCEQEIQSKPIDDSQAVGIDVGIAKFAYLSDGSFIESPYFLEPNLGKLRLLQRKLSRQKKGSNSIEKTKRQISKLHNKIKNQRKDFLHKVSTNIEQFYSSCYVEDLKISNMTKLNSTLSRRMLDNGFYSFRLMLEYKFKHNSKHFLSVNPAYTSQMCSSCGAVDKKSRLSQSEYLCTNCGFVDNSDLNAAKNIRAKGISFGTKRKVLA